VIVAVLDEHPEVLWPLADAKPVAEPIDLAVGEAGHALTRLQIQTGNGTGRLE